MALDPPTRRSCGVMDIHRRLLSVDAGYRAARAQIETEAVSRERRGGPIAPRRARTIPVVVHVVYRTREENLSDDQVRNQVRVMNRDFRKKNSDASKVPEPFKPFAADTKIQFKLASQNAFAEKTSGITRTKTSLPAFGPDDEVKSSLTGGADPWPSRRFLNIWVCSLGEGLLGYAQFPGGPGATDGVVVLNTAFGAGGSAEPPFDKGRTATHEVGHWLNLFHIWGECAQRLEVVG